MIGIANTHTLTSSASQFSVHGTTDVETLHFAPYTPSQLLEILQTRLAPLYDTKDGLANGEPKKFLPLPTLTLLTKKIAAQTGDVRSLFEVLRGAIDLAVDSSNFGDSTTDTNPLNTPTPIVTPTFILSALKAYAPASTTIRLSASTGLSASGSTSNSEIVTKVRNLGLQARLALLSILLASKRLEAGLALSGSPTSTSPTKSPVKRAHSMPHATTGASASIGAVGIDSMQLHAYYSTVLKRADNDVFTPVSRSEFADLIGMLETAGLAAPSSTIGLPGAGSGSPSKTGRRSFGRSSSFGGGKGKDRGQEVKLVEGVRTDEALRGMGIGSQVGGNNEAQSVDIREEEVRAIWERERIRLGKDIKARERCNDVMGDTFDGAVEN